VYRLENVPGINGDEAWYGVQAFQIATGQPFKLQTPTGLPLNPFFTGVEVPLLLAFRPSFWILRAPAVASGVLTVALVYLLGSRILGRTTAVVASLLLAVLPSAIGYSRFGWDASQTPLFNLLALYFAFRGRSVAMLVCFAMGLMAHVSNAFLLPVLLAPFLASLWSTEKWPSHRRWIIGITTGLALLGCIALVWVNWHEPRFQMASRLLPANVLPFLAHYGRLISGLTLYDYEVGPVSPHTRAWYDTAFWGLSLLMFVFGVPRLVRLARWDQLALVIGLVLGALGLYVVGGPEVMRPHRERYGMYLILPSVLVAACLISAMLPRPEGWGSRTVRPLAFVVMIAGGWVLLWSFKVHYFDTIRATGGESHVTFRTAEVEPKQQALQLILDDISRGSSSTNPQEHVARSRGDQTRPDARADREIEPVIVDNAWLYWPLRFLSSRDPEVAIVSIEDDESSPRDANGTREAARLAGLSSGGYAVAFTGGELEHLVTSKFPTDRLHRWDILDYGGNRLITTFRVQSVR
jgi:hypothetical protein